MHCVWKNTAFLPLQKPISCETSSKNGTWSSNRHCACHESWHSKITKYCTCLQNHRPKSPNTARATNFPFLCTAFLFLMFFLSFCTLHHFPLLVFASFSFLGDSKLRRSEVSPLTMCFIILFIIHHIWPLRASKKCECTLHRMAWQQVPLQVSGTVHSWMSNKFYKVHL